MTPVRNEGLGNTRMTWAGIAISLVCLYVALRGTDLRQVGSTLSQARLWFVLPLVLAQIAFYVLKAIRWRLLLVPVRSVPVRSVAAPMMIGFMGNNVLPARLGEVIRVFLGARLLRVPASQVLATLVLERMFDFVAVMVFFGWGLLVMGQATPRLLSAAYVAAAISVVGMAGAFVYVRWTSYVIRATDLVTRLLPERIRGAIRHQLELGASGMAALHRPSLVWGIAATSLLQWFLMAGCVYIAFLAVSINVPPSAAFVVLAATVFGVMIPAAPGFFGTLHLAFVLALTPFHVDESRAMAAAVFYHIIPYAGVILAGFYFLRQTGEHLHTVEREALQGEPERS